MKEQDTREISKEKGGTRFKAVLLSCPICRIGYKCALSLDLGEKMSDGVMRVLVKPDCNHKFIAFIDKNLNVRGYEKVDVEATNVETADANFMKKTIKELEKKHAEASDSNYNEAFEIMKEIRKLKEDYKNLHKRIIVK